jgi:membrane-associated phospholipid phosphatase
MNYNQTEGIVTFPSFHATLAIIMTYAVRRYRWALAVFGSLNCLMILAIPTVGGHYLVDLFGGAVVAGLAILLVPLIRRPLRGEGP